MSSYYTRNETAVIKEIVRFTTMATVCFISAWIFGWLGDKLGMSGTYWTWYLFSLISGTINRLIGFLPQG